MIVLLVVVAGVLGYPVARPERHSADLTVYVSLDWPTGWVARSLAVNPKVKAFELHTLYTTTSDDRVAWSGSPSLLPCKLPECGPPGKKVPEASFFRVVPKDPADADQLALQLQSVSGVLRVSRS